MTGFGATFYPGRDDYYLPPEQLNIVSPSPQRVMPEMPVQIADGLERLELEASNPKMHRNPSTRGYHDAYATPPSSQGPGSRPLSEDRHSSYHSSIADDYLSRFDSHPEELHHSPFPPLINPGPNIPPSDEEKEMQIEGARMDVLSSNDPEMQLVWAQDALNYVEIAMNHYTRIADPPRRPQTPPLEHQLRTDAINVVSFLAEQHHPRAQFMRGSWLEFGKFGFRVDKKEAFRCYARSAEKGFPRAEYRMGMQFENSNEPQKAIRHYERGAAAGDSASNYRLGMMTLLGQHGYKQDYAAGCELIRIAAESADENAPQGAYVYGMLLARELPGIDVPEGFLSYDLQLAREMIEKAAFLGFARAQLKMGTAYELCQLSCEFSPALSLHYNALAARQGEAEAEMAISKWFLCGHEGIFDKNEELAYEYARRAASSGLATAEFAIGYFYEIGMYVNVDLKEAQRWYAKAAEHGNKDASGRIDGISRSKTLSRRDHENVAIAKIKSRHGSMRGRNPRRPPAANHMPAAIEEVDMPEPNIPPSGQYDYAPGPPQGNQMRPPPRQGSIPPLNTSFIRTDDAPYGVQSALPPRSGTAIPYPTSAGGLGPGNQAPLRPSSAAGYGPQPRPMSRVRLADRPFSVATGGHGMVPAGYPVNGPPRTNTAMSNTGGPNGPLRRPSGSQGPPGPGSGPNGKHRPPPVDIGFVAPQQQPQPPKSPRPPRSPGPAAQHGRLPINNGPPTPLSPGPNGKPMGLPMSPSPNWGGAPQQQPMAPQQQPMVPQQQPQQQAMAPEPIATPRPPPTPTPASAAGGGKGPGKGPKTFEEMGVPQQQKEQDCCIM